MQNRKEKTSGKGGDKCQGSIGEEDDGAAGQKAVQETLPPRPKSSS